MNHIYKIVFNKATGTMTAVAEFARGHGKGSLRTKIFRPAVFRLSLLVAALGLAGVAQAEVAAYFADKDTDTVAPAIDTATAKTMANRVLGIKGKDTAIELDPDEDKINKSRKNTNNITTTLDANNNTVSVELNSHVRGLSSLQFGDGNRNTPNAKKNPGITIGNSGTKATHSNIAIGDDAQAILYRDDGIFLDESTIAIGSVARAGTDDYYKELVRIPLLIDEFGRLAYLEELKKQNKAEDELTSAEKIELLVAAQTKAEEEIKKLLKDNPQKVKSGFGSIAIGRYSSTKGDDSIALGTQAFAQKHRAMALGLESEAFGESSIAFGAWSRAGSLFSTALGAHTHAYARSATALGERAEVAFGATAGTALGAGAYVSVLGESGTAIGTAAQVYAQESTAVGSNAQARKQGAVALGANSLADRAGLPEGTTTASTTPNAAQNNVYSPTNTAEDNAEILATVKGTENGAVSVGATDETTRQIINVAAGSADSDAVNVAQLKAVAKLAKPTTITTAADGKITIPATNGDNPVTANSVATVINGTFWNVADNAGVVKGKVNPADTVKFADGDGTTATVETENQGVTVVKYDVAVDGSTIEVKNGKLTAKVPTITTTTLANANGAVTTPANGDENKLVNAGDIANAINQSGFNIVGAGNNADPNKPFANQLIKPSNTVTLEAGKNLTVAQEGGKFTFATKDDVDFNTVSTQDLLAKNAGVQNLIVPVSYDPMTNKLQNITINKDGIDMANTPIINVASTLPNTLNNTVINTPNISAPVFTSAQKAHGASVDDVLNAGFNLQGNDIAKDFVKPFDTLNFVNGNGTTANVTTTDGGKVSAIKYDVAVDGTTIQLVNGVLTAVGGNSNANTSVRPVQVNSQAVVGTPNFIDGQGTTVTNNNGVIKVDSPMKYENAANNPSTPSDTVSMVGDSNAPVQIQNVASGVRGQIKDANGNVVSNPTKAQVATAVAGANGGTVNNVATIGDLQAIYNQNTGPVQYSDADGKATPATPSNDVTLVGGDVNAPVTIHNVAAGKAPSDAVNLAQLDALGNRLNARIGDVQSNANAGTSSAMAMAALPQAYLPGKSMVSGGIATYNGQGAVAVGVSKLSDNGRWVIKANGTADTKGNVGGAVGAGMHF